jgi:RNA polymerase sigma-70 factor (ECF subfamily)
MELCAAYEAHAVLLLRLAMLQCRDSELARDAVQEAFLRFYVERSMGRGVEAPRAWLARVVSNYLVDEARRAQTRRRYATADHLPAQEAPSNPRAVLPIRIRRALSPREFQCVDLRSQGFSYDEVAEALGIRAGTVASLMSRAHRKLRPIFGEKA